MSLMQIRDLTYKYESSRKNVLNKINAEFEKGKVYTIVGKSGSGKTTLLSLISGLDVSTGGDILFNGKNLREIDRDDYRAKSIGVVFQSYNLLLNATAVENIVLSMNISGRNDKYKKEYAYDILDKVGIDLETADRKILKLSGGEQQRVGIARALAHNPDIIIADEPTGNLDNETEADIMEILADLAHNDNKCVIIVTHSRKVTSYADEIYGIADGKLIPVSIGKNANKSTEKSDKYDKYNNTPVLDRETFAQLDSVLSAHKIRQILVPVMIFFIYVALINAILVISFFFTGLIPALAILGLAVIVNLSVGFIIKLLISSNSRYYYKLNEYAEQFQTTQTQLRKAYLAYKNQGSLPG